MDDRDIHESLSRLDPVRRAIFSAACAERSLHDFADSGATEDDVRAAIHDLELVWTKCLGAPVASGAIDQRRDAWLRVVCEDADRSRGRVPSWR